MLVKKALNSIAQIKARTVFKIPDVPSLQLNHQLTNTVHILWVNDMTQMHLYYEIIQFKMM